jgi:uncharacterized protein (DUF488 family)
VTMLSVGHGTLAAEELAALLAAAGVERLVDIRRHPGSRRHPAMSRARMEQWLPAAYRWDEALGGRRTPAPGSPNTALRDPQLRGYADHMATAAFRAAVERLRADELAPTRAAVMCAEADWRRCHRALLADHLTLVAGITVTHLTHDGALTPHRPHPQARREGGRVVYGEPGRLPL